MDVGVVSYLCMVSLVLCPSLLQIHPAGSLFQVSEYLPPLICGVLGHCPNRPDSLPSPLLNRQDETFFLRCQPSFMNFGDKWDSNCGNPFQEEYIVYMAIWTPLRTLLPGILYALL